MRSLLTILFFVSLSARSQIYLGKFGAAPSCTNVSIVESALPDGTVSVLYYKELTLTGTAPFTLGSVTKPSWMTISISGSKLIYTGHPSSSGTSIVVNVTVTNCTAGTDSYNDLIDIVEYSVGRANLIFEDTFDDEPPYTPKWSVSQFCCAYSVVASTDTVRIPGKSVRFEQRQSDWTNYAEKRAELQHLLSEGAVHRWYGMAFYFPASGYPPDDIQIINQWHHESASGSPPLSLNTQGSKYYVVWSNGGSENYDEIAGISITYDTWIDVVYEIQWAGDASGFVKIYFDGVLRYERHGANMIGGLNNYAKIGHYKFSYASSPLVSTSTKRVMFMDEFRIGNENATIYDVTPGNY